MLEVNRPRSRRPMPGALVGPLALTLAMAVLLASCSSDADDATDSTTEVEAEAGSDDGGSDDPSSDDDPSSNGEGTVGDDDDAAAIVDNPDLDLDELAEVAPEAAEALDDIDDIVSIGDCTSETVGLTMSVVPDGWQCRVLDQAIGGLDGFTLFEPGGSDLEITVGTPSPLGSPCEVLGMCDDADPIDLGTNTTMSVIDFGVPIIFGTHNTVEAEIAVTTTSELSPEQVGLVTEVLEGLVPA